MTFKLIPGQGDIYWKLSVFAICSNIAELSGFSHDSYLKVDKLTVPPRIKGDKVIYSY
jgi:hypothetical protein